MPILIL